MRLLSACLSFSLRNLAQHKIRSLAATAGITFALFLIFLQWGLLDGAKRQITAFYDYFDYDIVVLDDAYQFMFTAEPFDRIRLMQAQALESVEKTFAINFALGIWEDNASHLRSTLMLFGVDPDSGLILEPSISEGLKSLHGQRNILIDALSHSDFGSLTPGTRALINGQEVQISSHFRLGLFFYAEGAALVDNTAFSRLAQRSARDTSFGMIRLKEGADPWVEREKLARLLPGDVIALTKEELLGKENSYFVNVKPLGIIFTAGVSISFVTATVILFQVISTSIATRLREYATLRAMGFGFGFVFGSAAIQAFTLSSCAFAGAAVISAALFGYIFQLTNLPLALTRELIILVLGMTQVMCLAISFATLRDLSRMHPADLY